jgi:signal transduction histidine kinase
MKSPDLPRSPRPPRTNKVSRDIALTAREHLVAGREASVRQREGALQSQEAALRAREASAETRADVERLMGQMREANERLIVAAIDAQNLSDEAHADAVRAKTELDDLMKQLGEANERLAATAAHAHALAEEAQLRQEEYRQLSGRLLTLQDDERRRLALDLHDSTAQCLAALAVNLDLVDATKTVLDARSHRALAESRSLVEQTSREVRTLAYLLHPPLLDEMGLPLAVRWFTEGFTMRSGIQVALDLGEVGRLSAPIERAVFRVVQESLTNVHRHASTKAVTIRLASTPDAVGLEIRDQGRGLRDRKSHKKGDHTVAMLGVGIQGMRERIRQLNGTFDVKFTDRGTTVRVSVPLSVGTA